MSAEKQENRRVVLIGDPSSKRTAFFRKAADSLGIAHQEMSWENIFDLKELQGASVKIDPPPCQTVRLCQMQEQLKAYRRRLQHLAQADCRFLNHPEAICQMLDKRETNLRLKARGIPVTEMFPEKIRTVGQLEAVMEERRCYSVFIKPRYFSGAAGAAAFRMHPGIGQRKLYTSCRLEQGQLINTKRLACLEGNEEISRFLEQLLSLECVVERWHPKADFHGKSYDLRAVFQFGHIAALIARQSKGPITNLHLNNQALDVRELGLDETIMEQITSVCQKAYDAFSGSKDWNAGDASDSRRRDAEGVSGGVSMAGIDLLLEKGTLRPRVIEMNGQGDLIYRDIYGENRIYKEQVSILGTAKK